MMNCYQRKLCLLFGAASIVFSTELCRGVEAWADPGFTQTNGLELWLDASRENQARAADQLAPFANGAPINYWHDGSGKGRHLSQALRDARPGWRRLGKDAFVRFDGRDDFLRASLSDQIALSNLTVIIMAAVHSDVGGFRGFISWSPRGGNDFQKGFNIDLGNGAGEPFHRLNVEGAGHSGERDLLQKGFVPGKFHLVSVVSSRENGYSTVQFDGEVQGKRTRKPELSLLQELIVGARQVDNSGKAPYIQCYLQADIAEVLVYSRELPETELRQVEEYLRQKHSVLGRNASDPNTLVEKELSPVSNPPLVHVLVPGFEVRELPLRLQNLNNFVYAPDGRLFVLAYDGNVFQLSDTDGDGLEDNAKLFWNNEKGEIPSSIGMTWGPGGLYIPCFKRVVHLRDKGDGTAELQTVTGDWVAPASYGGSSLDAVGIAAGPDGSIYFGLGCDAWNRAYKINKETGKSEYDITSERGTILKVSPDWSKREIICTGIRWPTSLAFNKEGDLFCADQEGATWLPNGNPFDELLHIQKGRHYGFPPRHPKYLPNVIDEPSVFDYGPQHQSTCGFHFNDGYKGGPIFGPAWWRSDALIAGESRGKIYRTKLVKTPEGYVAQNQLIACLGMLAIDAIPTPEGDLLVTCHSGEPDWGSGPKGMGKIFKIFHKEKDVPQPVLVNAVSPTEFQITFDRRIDLQAARGVVGKVNVAAGKYVAAGDRFETMRPGYQVVQNQLAAPRYELPVHGVYVGNDEQTVTVRTAPHQVAWTYGISIETDARRFAGENPSKQSDAYAGQIDLATDLTGVSVTWRSEADSSGWNGWWPHLNIDVARAMTEGSAGHSNLWKLVGVQGTLRLETQLNLWEMLQPATQPGSKLDYVPEVEMVTVTLRSDSPFEAEAEDRKLAPKQIEGAYRASFTVPGKEHGWTKLGVTLPTGKKAPELRVTWHTDRDPRERAFPLRRFMLPWARPDLEDDPNSGPRVIPEIAGGNWEGGRKLFTSEKLACAKCHQVGSLGRRIGPDLSNLVHRDYASVLKDIVSPNGAINPEHLSYEFEIKEAEPVTGVLLAERDGILEVGSATGENIRIPRKTVTRMTPLKLSLMPEGLLEGLTKQEQRDLMTFLLTPSATK